MPFHQSQYEVIKISRCLSSIVRPQLVESSIFVTFARAASSSTRWKSRQSRDQFSREAKVQGLKSRAAFKLLEINQKYRLFKPGATVVDLGFAPGSWSQVAIDRTQPGGRVVGIDLIPAQPPRGVSTIQGNFLSPEIQAEVRAYVQDHARGRAKHQINLSSASSPDNEPHGVVEQSEDGDVEHSPQNDIYGIDISHEELAELAKGYIDQERETHLDTDSNTSSISSPTSLSRDSSSESEKEGVDRSLSQRERDEQAGRVVDVVLSDMSAPWAQTSGFSQNSVSDVYRRMMNTSGNSFRDHVKSMDLCMAALTFAFDTLKTGGHLVCKYYQGAEDKELEGRMKKLFEKVHRDKPEASRKESKEGFFIALRRKAVPTREQIFS